MATGGESTTGGGKGSAVGAAAAAAAAVGGRGKGAMGSPNETAVERPYKLYRNSAVAALRRLTPPLLCRKHTKNENFLPKMRILSYLFII